MKDKIYDLVIVGAGPAGLAAAIYGCRRQLTTLVLAASFGGQAALNNEIGNYPGFEKISGFELADRLKKQAEKVGAKFELATVKKIAKKNKKFLITADNGQIEAAAVILAFGLGPRKLGVKGEAELTGRGVAYCAICDGPLFKNKTVAVVGGGNAAVESAQYLASLAKKVYLIHRSDEFRAESYLLNQAQKLSNLEFYCHSRVAEIKGDKKLTAVVLKDVKSQKKEELAVEGLFIEIGYQAQTDWLKGLVKLNQRGEIETNKETETSVAGVFAAGDCASGRFKQIIIATGEGARAALMAYDYLIKVGVKATAAGGRCELVGSDQVAKIKLGRK